MAIFYDLASQRWTGRLRRTGDGGWTGTVKRLLVVDFQHACDNRANYVDQDWHRYFMTGQATISADGELTLTPTGDIVHQVGPEATGNCGSYNFPPPDMPLLADWVPNWVRHGPEQTAKARGRRSAALRSATGTASGTTYHVGPDAYIQVHGSR